MGIFNSSNPTMNQDVFRKLSWTGDSNVMTVEGSIQKAIILGLLTCLTAGASWYYASLPQVPNMMLLLGSAIVGLILAIVLSFKPNLAPTLAPIYAVVEGYFLGVISFFFDSMFPGIAFQAIFLTLGILMMMLFLYRAGIIKVTERFRMIITMAIAGIALFYLVGWVVSMFTGSFPGAALDSTLGLVINIVVVIVASLSLAMDFDFIEQGAKAQAPKYMELYAAFGLLVTVIWLYLEILKLLARLAANRD